MSKPIVVNNYDFKKLAYTDMDILNNRIAYYKAIENIKTAYNKNKGGASRIEQMIEHIEDYNQISLKQSYYTWRSEYGDLHKFYTKHKTNIPHQLLSTEFYKLTATTSEEVKMLTRDTFLSGSADEQKMIGVYKRFMKGIQDA